MNFTEKCEVFFKKEATMYQQLINNLSNETKILLNEPMKNHTSFKIGGPADILIMPDSVDDIRKVLNFAKDVPLYIIGNGSNLLVNDDGIRGIVLKISNCLNKIDVDGEYIVAGAGATLALVSNIAKKNSLTGMEWACGIPGSIGGAVYMNAGAYGGEMKDIIVETVYINENNEICVINNKAHNFSYRKSIFTNTKNIILETKLRLEKGNQEEIEIKMKELLEQRRVKQPLEYPSAGSTFKRPEGYFVGKIMDDLGLKGYTIGGAQVSEKHGGFIINTGNATAKDVKDLIEYIVNKVKKEYNIELEPELKII